MLLVPIIFWGATLLSIALSAVGVLRRSPWMLVLGAILASPLAFYLGATPAFRIWAWFLPGLHLLAAVIGQRSARAAVVPLLPFTGLALWLAIAVVADNFRL